MTLFEANKSNLIVRYTELFTSGSAKVYFAEFRFSADWDGLTKVATFRNGSVSKTVAINDMNIYEIPWEVFANSGTLECGITGIKEDGTTLPTIWATVAPIRQGAEIGDEAKEVTPDIYEQLIARLDEGVTQAQNAAERAEASAIHQPYPNSVTGTWWVWNTESGEYADSGISSAAYTLPPMTGTALGGAMADPAQESDTQPVRIGADNKLYTAPGGGASGAVSSVNGKTGAVRLFASDVGAISSPATAVVGQTIVVKAVDETGKPTEWEAADLPSGGSDKELTLLANINFEGNAASGFDYTGLDNVSEIYIVGGEIKSAMDNAVSNFSLRINDIEVATYAVLTIQKTSGIDTWNSYNIMRFNGAFWESLRSPDHAGSSNTAHTNYARYSNSVVLDVGKAQKISLYVPNPAYKPVTGWMKIWVR